VARAYCPLSILGPKAGSQGWDATDCRKIFPPLTSMVRMVYLGGDGQEAMPTAPTLAHPLRVGVVNGGLPVDGARVRFSIVTGPGQVSAAQLNGGSGFVAGPVTVDTVAGVASCQWKLDPTQHDQRVRAELLQYGADPNLPDIHFNANLSEAKQVHFAAPQDCTGLAGSTTVQDALERLARTANLFYVGGDGQHAVQGQALEQPLTVRLVSDCGPVQGVKVTFTASGTPTGPGGVLSTSDAGGGSSTLEVTTGADGKAEAYWHLADAGGAPVAQQVIATLPATLAQPWRRGGSTSVRFGAKRLLANQVGYQPSANCTALKGATHVQAALDLLCAQSGGRRPGITVTGMAVGNASSNRPLANDDKVTTTELAEGVMIALSQPAAALAFNGPNGAKPVFTITLDLPHRMAVSSQTAVALEPVIGTLPLTLEGEAFPATVGGDPVVMWKPSDMARRFLTDILFKDAAEGVESVLAHLRLKGRFIWSQRNQARGFLSGLAFARPESASGLTLPSEQDEAGIDFEMWFRIVHQVIPTKVPIKGPGQLTGSATGGRTGGTAAPGGIVLRDDAAPGGTVALASLDMPATLRPGEQAQGTVRLSGPAPKGGFEVTLSSGDRGGVKEEVVVPAGKTEAPFRLDVGSAKVGSRVTITATTDAGVLHKRVVIK
jgi:hypothetical protein